MFTKLAPAMSRTASAKSSARVPPASVIEMSSITHPAPRVVCW
jgi:hypothetical protein